MTVILDPQVWRTFPRIYAALTFWLHHSPPFLCSPSESEQPCERFLSVACHLCSSAELYRLSSLWPNAPQQRVCRLSPFRPCCRAPLHSGLSSWLPFASPFLY